MNTAMSIDGRVAEYRAMVKSAGGDAALVAALVAEGEWTPPAAEHLVRLAREYGSFMLTNALAVSLALGVEDGALGF